VTATDLVLTITEMLRKEKVVGKFVEFFGEGTASLSLTDRATIANMAPEYGATMGFFPVDEATIDYFHGTGRTKVEIDAFEAYFKAQNLFGIPKAGDIDYSNVVTLDLTSVAPSLAGPKRPQDRIEIGHVKSTFRELFAKPVADNGFNKKAEDLDAEYTNADGVHLKNGDVLIAAITFLINSRHLLMGAAMTPYIQHLPKRKAIPALLLMCDESFALGLADAQKRAAAGRHIAFSLPYYMGTAIAFYLTWVLFTALGGVLGPFMGDIETHGFDLAFPAVFLVLLRGMWKGMKPARPWLVSLIVAAGTYAWIPGAWYVLAGALSGILAAWLWADAR
jgi:predicted branched-subunit amino acid permease